ncbi:nuclear transport factor 2 family protein [Amycolatopsis pithecellobii]|uniref:nuclear transport factor 2 family protein n=1 Tax=Amycolatopsis pithecellobii TaxID=664692 RepID=UPI00140773B6|nr:nuclear transport factor 2 family protein [Amycolatopsis pithecellobii]
MLDRFYDAEMRYVAAGGAPRGAGFDEMAACFHPEAVMRQGPSAPFPGEWKGIQEVERFFAVLSETWVSAEGLTVRYFAGDDGVAVSMRVHLTSRATGRTVDSHLAQFITFDGGLIRDFTVFYLDPVRLREACGLPGVRSSLP